jgi:hypothetical protein
LAPRTLHNLLLTWHSNPGFLPDTDQTPVLTWKLLDSSLHVAMPCRCCLKPPTPATQRLCTLSPHSCPPTQQQPVLRCQHRVQEPAVQRQLSLRAGAWQMRLCRRLNCRCCPAPPPLTAAHGAVARAQLPWAQRLTGHRRTPPRPGSLQTAPQATTRSQPRAAALMTALWSSAPLQTRVQRQTMPPPAGQARPQVLKTAPTASLLLQAAQAAAR